MLLTVNEAKERLGITRSAIYDAMARGELTYVEKYGKRLLHEKSVSAYSPRAYPRSIDPPNPSSEISQS